MTWSRKLLLWELNEAYALGKPGEYRNLDGSMWPRLYHDETGNHYILEEYSGSQSVFDDQGLMIGQKDPQGRMISYEYSEDKLSKILYPEGVYMEFVYDAHGLLSEVKNNDGSKITVSRNSRGEIISITDEENRTVHIERDIMGRVIKEISPGKG